ncbi:hypothetical protein RND71_032267 [Anisodus tanguticus]|uniref:Uncharacterized protein n=1 Tax=Anisodus tanguticus TaxID=243964 RepID=A0AAE1REW7_9SOLA|nr:hypothetical protein RND71_032267 [Anisodus tanguticus]
MSTTHKAHCLILPYPMQGHINPMLQFSKRLQSKGVKITIAPTKSFLKTMKELPTPSVNRGHLQVIDWMANIYPMKTIGPTIPSMYLDKRLPDDKEYGMSLFKPMANECLNWLNRQPISSVVYVSFGSMAKLEAEQMEELAWGLKNSNKNFLWVVRSTEEPKLPKNFLDELASEKAISLGVPMVTMPQWSDQPTNTKLVQDVWEMGIKAKQDEKGIVRREVIEECIKLVMEEEKGNVIRGNAKKWKELARNAMDEGGVQIKTLKNLFPS